MEASKRGESFWLEWLESLIGLQAPLSKLRTYPNAIVSHEGCSFLFNRLFQRVTNIWEKTKVMKCYHFALSNQSSRSRAQFITRELSLIVVALSNVPTKSENENTISNACNPVPLTDAHINLGNRNETPTISGQELRAMTLDGEYIAATHLQKQFSQRELARIYRFDLQLLCCCCHPNGITIASLIYWTLIATIIRRVGRLNYSID